MTRRPVIAITPGEPAGVGPELCAALEPTEHAAQLVLIASRDLLEQAADRKGHSSTFAEYRPGSAEAGLQVLDVPLAAAAVPGELNPANGRSVIETIDRGVDGCVSGAFDALVTAPVHKGIINDCGIPFTGHTEYLAQRTATEEVVMMLAAGDLRVALVTTHLPLSQVPAAINRKRLQQTIRIVDRDLRDKFRLSRPRLLVCGLNPHAGEGGHLGREEIEIIEPALNELRTQGFDLSGPLLADTAFTRRHLDQADAVIAMYHDQGLPTLKYAGFGRSINITLGLPIIRTSVDHGTALDIAGTGKADGGSLKAAIACAVELCQHRASG
jgi:4-hydroxythreonine-4-phosphate dehydrogenase